MKQITDIRELRQLQLAIMDDIHQFCEQNGIRYSLAGGTLIGAFRHQGYIPWDDDIDIYLMRSDYERFLKEYKDKNGRFQLLCPEQTEHYFYTFAKVIDTQTVMIEDETEGYEIGVYVDVFPLDYVTDNLRHRQRIFRWKHLLYKIRRCKISQKNYLKSKLAYYCYRYLPVSVGTIEWLIEYYIHRRKPSKTICEMCETDRPLHGCFSVHAMKSTIDVPFEGRRYKSMIGYDLYLTNTYGDYMKIPPKDQQIQHKFKAYYK
jgi:lipopolysaccharide cholinephosphotransferase